jgi:hypothetical protein
VTRSPVGATVLVDGRRIADTGDEFIEGASTVLTDAQVVWGRSTVVDQPESSTCTCTIARREMGAPGFLAGLRVGARLDLTTSGTNYPDPTVSTFLDPGFDTGVGGRTPTNADATIARPTTPTARINLVPVPNVSASISGWSFGSGSTTAVVPGGRQITTTAALPAGTSLINRAAYDIAVGPAGTSVAAQFAVQVPADAPAVTLKARIITAGGGNTSGPNVTIAPGATAVVPFLGVNNTTGATSTIRISLDTISDTPMPVGARIVVLDGVTTEAATTLGTPFTGDTPDTAAINYEWTAAANASPSVALPVGVTMRRNLVTNPNIDTNLTGWVLVSTSTIERDTTVFHSGTASVKINPGTGDSGASFTVPGGVAGVIGTTYTASAWVKGTAGETWSVRMRTGTASNETVVPFVMTGAWQRVSASRVADTTGAIAIQIRQSAAGLHTVWVDDAMIEAAPAMGTYFDGNTPSTPTVAYLWTGTANASASVAITSPPLGDPRLQVDPLDAARPASVILAPDAFVAHGADPDAWDDIPATSLGQVWGYGARVLAPPGSVVEVRPVVFTAPSADSAVVLDVPLVPPSDGAWHTVAGTFLPNLAGAWVGIEVRSFPTGPAWADLPPALTWATVTPPGWRWVDYARVLVDDVLVTAPAAGVTRTALVFSGRITDLSASYDDELPGGGGVSVEVTAQDFTADLANNRIGDDPWPVQALSTRVARILTLASTGVTALIDPSIAATLLTYRDVDSQPAAGLITEIAASVDAVAWSATHQTTGPYYWLEDPSQRPALVTLYVNPDTGLVTIGPTPAIDDALLLSACDLLRDPVQWQQDVADTSTRVDVTWLEQGVDDDGKPTATERHVVVINAPLEAALGQRGVSLSTQLQAQADAATVANRLLARVTATGWRVDGLTWDTSLFPLDPGDITTALDLLDGTTRIGRPVIVTDLPTWSPSGPALPLYIEGGSYTFAEGWWVFDLTTSSGVGGQGTSVTWAQLPTAWRWVDFDPAITWARLRGVAGPVISKPAPLRIVVPDSAPIPEPATV